MLGLKLNHCSKSGSAFPAAQFMITTRLIWKLTKCAIRWALQTTRVAVWIEFKHFGFSPIVYHHWRPSWILTSLVIRNGILTNFIVFVIHKNIYLEINFVCFWYLEVEIRFLCLAYFSGFSRETTFRHRFDYIWTTVSYINSCWMQIVIG